MKKILSLIAFLMPVSSFALGLITDFEWLEPSNCVEVVVGEPYQLKFSCSDNNLPFTSAYADSWVHYDFSGGQHVVNLPTGYSINDKGVITGLIPGSYAIKFTGWIQAKSGTDTWLYVTVVSERIEKEPNNSIEKANEFYKKIRFGLYNISDVDFFKFTDNSLKFGDIVTFRIQYQGMRENPLGYKWSTFSSTNMVGGGSLVSKDQVCKAIVTTGNTVYLEVYFDQRLSQYFNYGEEFVAEIYINEDPINEGVSGSCGTNITWKYSDTSKTLTIYGTGPMWNYTSSYRSPWNDYSSMIEKIIIEDGVTSIGDYAFYGCSSLTSVTIPSSVISIGENAFYGCSSLKKVVVPDIAAWCGIFFNGYHASPLKYAHHIFSDEKTEITNLVIPDGVTSIGIHAFRECFSLTSVTIPESVTIICDCAFDCCIGLSSFTIPNRVTDIGYAAFWGCSGLTSITIGNNVANIGEVAFKRCSSLTDVYCLTDKVPETNIYAFEDSPISSATLHVPVNSYNNYKTAYPWSRFGKIVSLEYRDILPHYISLLIAAKTELTLARGGGAIDLIRSHTQLNSPYTEYSEGSIAALLDGDISTFWHSLWKGGNVDGGVHYLQADLINSINEKVYAVFTRRPAANDHVTEMSIFGTNDPDASKTACEELLTFKCPYMSNTETITSPHFDTKGYHYLRFYANATSGNRGFWHISEFQLYRVIPVSESLVSVMDGEDERLQAIIDKQAILSSYQIGEAEYNELKDAYDTFMSKRAEIIDRIEDVSEGNIINSTSTLMFDLQGRNICKPQKGINFIRYSDGSTKKIVIK